MLLAANLCHSLLFTAMSSLGQQLKNAILAMPTVYRAVQYGVSGAAIYEQLVAEYIRPNLGDRVLDIGCGPGDLLHHLQGVTYVGFDENPDYIRFAQATFGDRGKFYCNRVSSEALQTQPSFDIVLGMAILHHLDDTEARQLFQLAGAALKSGGRFVTVDPCYVDEQSPVARWLISMDRGQYVRTKAQYLELAETAFTSIQVSIRHDRLRIPYTHIILECQ
jgi:SAM-dependent methyltransferase